MMLTNRTELSCEGSYISQSRWRDVWWGGRCLLPGDVAACSSGEPVRRIVCQWPRFTLWHLSHIYNILPCACVQRPCGVCVADGKGSPVPPLCSRHWELLPSGESRGGAHSTGDPPAATGRHQLSGTAHVHADTQTEDYRLRSWRSDYILRPQLILEGCNSQCVFFRECPVFFTDPWMLLLSPAILTSCSPAGSPLPAAPADDESSCAVPGQQGGGLRPTRAAED